MASNYRLFRRGTVWYYRRRVPLNLRAFFGRGMVMVSMRTGDRKKALSQRPIRDLEWDAKFAEADDQIAKSSPAGTHAPTAQTSVLTKEVALQMVVEYVERTDSRRSERWAVDPPEDAEERREAIRDRELSLAIAQGAAPQYDTQSYLSDAWAKIFGPKSDVEDAEQRAAVNDLVRRACVEIEQRALARAADRLDRSHFDALFDPARPRPVTVRRLAEEFIALKAEEGKAFGTSAKHLDKQRGNLALIREIVGDGVMVRDIDWDVCRKLLSVLSRVPSNRTKKYKGQNLDEAIKLAESEGNSVLGLISQQQYLATFKELLDLAVKKDLIRTNYASDLRPLTREEVAPEDRTVPFDPAQLQSFFHSKFYAACSQSIATPYRAASPPWRFWFPLLSLFCGMRPKETFQLHVADLKETSQGTLFLDLTETSDEDDATDPDSKKTLKTPTSRRQIPLHPELIAIGFPLFVEAQRGASSDPLLFRGIKRDQYGDPAAYPLRRFREKFLKEGMTLRARQTAYSFRHTWRDAARMIDASDDFLKAVGAWKGTLTTSDLYGSKHNPDHYAPVLAKIAFPGVDLSHLRCKSDGT